MDTRSAVQIQKDWDERGFSDAVIGSILKCTDLVNRFGVCPSLHLILVYEQRS